MFIQVVNQSLDLPTGNNTDMNGFMAMTHGLDYKGLDLIFYTPVSKNQYK